MRVTVEALPGDSASALSFTWLAGSRSDGRCPGTSRAQREARATGRRAADVADKRAMAEGDTYGAGAVYRLRVDLVEKTPVDRERCP